MREYGRNKKENEYPIKFTLYMNYHPTLPAARYRYIVYTHTAAGLLYYVNISMRHNV